MMILTHSIGFLLLSDPLLLLLLLLFLLVFLLLNLLLVLLPSLTPPASRLRPARRSSDCRS